MPEAAAVDQIDDGLPVDELARLSGVSVRTIRFYQSKGLLDAPERRGRFARYSRAHVERLGLIANLHDYGLRLSAIQELLSHAGDGTTTSDWLGLQQAMRRPWTDDHPTLLGEAELGRRLAGTPDDSLDALVGAAIVERREDTTPVVYLVPSPGMLDIALEALELGVDLDTAIRLLGLLQSRLRDMAAELVATFTDQVSQQRLEVDGPARLGQMLDRMQPLARRTVDLLFAHEMERANRQLIESVSAYSVVAPDDEPATDVEPPA